MISRDLAKKLESMSEKFPVVAVLGPRQSGKTTLARAVFDKYKYVSLEDLDVREFAQLDPRGFLDEHHNDNGIILDEIQNVPSLLSYIQTYVDDKKRNGYFILTGSQNFLVQNFLVNEAISQTLAGRVSILTLLPLSIHEMGQANIISENVDKSMFFGCYPRIYDQKVSPLDWYPNYIKTYLERDVRQIKNVANLTTFQRFIKLCAGRIGQLVNFSSLGNDCGVSSATAKSWLSLLEASYIIFLLQPHYKNFSKRLIKSPKIYFYDTGLACSLLGISSIEQVNVHYLRGGLFESYIISDLMKQYFNKGLEPRLYFWRDKIGNEVDCILEASGKLIPIEIKAGKTISRSFFNGINYWSNISKSDPKNGYIVYSGQESQKRQNGNVVGWKNLQIISKI